MTGPTEPWKASAKTFMKSLLNWSSRSVPGRRGWCGNRRPSILISPEHRPGGSTAFASTRLGSSQFHRALNVVGIHFTVPVTIAMLLAGFGQLSFAGQAEATSDAPVLYVKGSVRYITYLGGAPDVRVDRPFELWVCGSESYARLGPGSGPDAGRFNGIEIYCHTNSIDTALVVDTSRLTNRPVSGKSITNIIEVVPGPIPFGGVSHFTPIWFAYASGDFMNRLTDDRIKRFYTLSQSEFELTNFFVKFVPEKNFNGGTSAIGRVSFYSTGTFVVPLGNGKFIEKTCLKPYDQGYLDAVYKVDDNFDGAGIPKLCSFCFYQGVVGATTNTEVKQGAAYQVEATSFKFVRSAPVTLSNIRAASSESGAEQASFQSAFNSESAVHDSRVFDSSRQPLSYVTTNGVRPLSDPRVKADLASRNEFLAEHPLGSSKGRRLRVLGFLIFISAAFIAWIAFTSHNQRKTKTENH